MKPSVTILISVLANITATYITVKMTEPHNSTMASAVSKSESAYDRVMRTGVLRCGYGISPPALVKDVNTGKLSGLDYDIWQAIGQQLGVKIEWSEEVGWGNFIEGLRTHRYDAFCSQLWADTNRSKYMILTMPLIYSFVNTYVRADDHRFDAGLDTLNQSDVTIPAVEGDVTMMMAKIRFPNAKILSLPQTSTISDMFLSVMTRKADAVSFEQAMFVDFDKQNKGVLRKLDNIPPSFVFGSYYGFNQGEFALRDMVNIAIRSMIDDGSLERMAHSYSMDYSVAVKNYKTSP